MKKHPSRPELLQAPPLIQRSDAQTLFQRFGYRALTIIFWLLFLSFFRLAITPVAWWLGAQSVYELFSYKLNADDFALQLSLYGLVIVLIGLTLIGWARYNQLRFTRRERRTIFLPPVAQEDTQRFFALTEQQQEVGARSRRLVIHHAEDGRPVALEGEVCRSLIRVLEPVPLKRFSYHYRGFSVSRDKTLQWVVLQGEREIFRDGEFENCREYVDRLTAGSVVL